MILKNLIGTAVFVALMFTVSAFVYQEKKNRHREIPWQKLTDLPCWNYSLPKAVQAALPQIS